MVKVTTVRFFFPFVSDTFCPGCGAAGTMRALAVRRTWSSDGIAPDRASTRATEACSEVAPWIVTPCTVVAAAGAVATARLGSRPP